MPPPPGAPPEVSTPQDCETTGDPPVQLVGEEVRMVRLCSPFEHAPHAE
jgi:hypothetical protein